MVQLGFILLPIGSVLFLLFALMAEKAFGDFGSIVAILYSVTIFLSICWPILYRKRIRQFLLKKGSEKKLGSILAALLVLTLFFGLAMLSQRPRFDFIWDVTTLGKNTLSEQSQRIIEHIDSRPNDLEVTGFFQNGASKTKFIALLNLYKKAGLTPKIRFYNPVQEPAIARKANITLSNTVLVKLGKVESRLTDFTEEKFTNSLLRILFPKIKKVFFTSGHGELDINDETYKGMTLLVKELENYSYTVSQGSLLEITEKSLYRNETLAIIGPTYDFRLSEISILNRYLEQGGNIVLLIDAFIKAPNLINWAKQVGIEINDDHLHLRVDDPRAKLIGQNNAIVSGFDEYSAITKDFAQRAGTVLMTSNSRSIEMAPDRGVYKVRIVAWTGNEVASQLGRNDLSGQSAKLDQVEPKKGHGLIAVATGLAHSPKITENLMKKLPGKIGDIIPLSGKDMRKRVRLVVGGSSSLASNGGVQRGENFDLMINIFNFLLEDENFITIRPKIRQSSRIEFNSHWSRFNLLAASFIYPFLFLFVGLFFWHTRKVR